MSSRSNPSRLLEGIVSACILVLLGTAALYGAVVILKSIWIWLVVFTFVGLIAAGTWIVYRRGRGW